MAEINQETLAELLFPGMPADDEAIQRQYPPRVLPSSAWVTRSAPSPTGFIHIGSLFVSLICRKLAQQTGGVFILRIEDTDKKREIAGGIENITSALHTFGLEPQEGVIARDEQRGVYGPYLQSERLELYALYAKRLVSLSLAYPCFCSEESLEQTRSEQELARIRTGYYGKWAKHRDASLELVKQSLSEGKKFAIRLRSGGIHEQKFPFHDLIKGDLLLSENDQDVVLLKSDGFPTYHFAHVVDDHLMGVTHVFRGDEWLSSVPIHVELFRFLGWQTPQYGHTPPIMKSEGASRRKLSKRKDPEANVEYYVREGMLKEAVIDYLMTLANPSFEDWRRERRFDSYEAFELQTEHINVSGALLDMRKLADIAKEVISYLPAQVLYERILAWARVYDTPFGSLLESDPEYALRILNIEKTGDKRRKDISRWSEAKEFMSYFFDSLFSETPHPAFERVSAEDAEKILIAFSKVYMREDNKEVWFGKIREIGKALGYAEDMRQYKAHPETFRGNVADVSMVVRLVLTKRMQTPDLWEIMQVMGSERVQRRLAEAMR